MSKSKPWASLSTILCRALSSTSRSYPNFASNIHQSMIFLPATKFCVDPSRVFQNPRFNFVDSLRISWKCWYSHSSDEDVNLKCWNCDAVVQTLPFLFCKSCRSIQPVDKSVDYFRIFGLERVYEIDVDGLEGKYKDWQKQLHPDLVHMKSEKEREYAAEQSARVIDAYGTLRKSLSRAIYILKLEGIEYNEEETLSEPELLSEIMEIREAVEEAADEQTLSQIQCQMQEKLKHWSNSFAKAFQSRNFDEAITSIQRMTYYERVNEEIVKKL